MPRVPRRQDAPARADARNPRKSLEHAAFGTALSKSSSRPPVPRKPRKPKPKNVIAHSILRPHVRADDRLEHWTSPFSIASRIVAKNSLPESCLKLLFSVVLASIEPRTRKNYGAGLLRFHQFCDLHGIPERDRMPASELLLAAFTSAWVGKVRAGTIDNWLSGLHFWHMSRGAQWCGDRLLKATCTTAGKVQPPPKPKRPPVTIEHMHALRSGLDLTDAFDAAVYALACAAFWGCRRLGELLLQSPKEFDPKRNVARRADIHFRAIRGTDKAYAVFHIPWTKTTKTEGADIVLVGNEDPTSPVQAFRHHLNANAAVPETAPMFSFETADGQWAPMTRAWFLERGNSIWKSKGLGTLTGHCFRIGGATEHLLRGTHPDMVATLGSWRSRAFLEYWRKIEFILPLFISNSFDQSRMQLVSDTMKDYKKRYGLK
ncbi:hypothetical protein C8T65DRAFT_589124 [Cerioporus squamosus]|nr:hypothetical protein C8T65DRAFT_589124 [Cerioporus squamosus]